MVSNTSGIVNNQELQNDIFEIAFIGMLIFSEEGEVVRYNKEAASVFEYNERLTGKSFEDLFVIDPATNPMNVIFGNKTVKDSYWENIIQIRNNKENVLWSNIRLNTIKGTDKYERLILCQILKTSAPDNPEANHEFYYHLLLELINNIPDNIFIKDAKSRFILANTCVAELSTRKWIQTGLEPMPKSSTGLFPAENLPPSKAAMASSRVSRASASFR